MSPESAPAKLSPQAVWDWHNQQTLGLTYLSNPSPEDAAKLDGFGSTLRPSDRRVDCAQHAARP